MKDPVSDLLAPRLAETEALSTTLLVSVAAHAAALAMILFAPWPHGPRAGDEPLMTISLGGAPGPQAGGMTSLGGRPVQKETPPPPKPEPVQPPAPKTPAMTVPEPKPKPAPKTPPPPVPTSTTEARGRVPVAGTKVTPGSTVAQTGSTGLDFGLSTGGGGTGGQIDLANFCCPDYISTMIQLITRGWNPRQGIPGQTTMRFTINRDGSVSDVTQVTSSGYAVLDMAAQRALLTLRLPPLPPAYTNEQLTVHLSFKYQ
ncbi:MAG: TonB family protein [Vicinamibacterales bacterium]|mgnify:CR=1 FL=1